MRLNWVSVSLVALALVVSASCTGSRQTAVQQTAGMSNTELQNRVRDRLDSDQDLKGSKILVDPDAGQKRVALSGSVNSEDLHSKAINTAQAAVPGITVVDRIEVQPPELARTDQGTEAPGKAHPNDKTRAGRKRR
jgi:osmotically-inducible protein OsmY